MAGCLSKAERQMPVVQLNGKGGDPYEGNMDGKEERVPR